MEKIRSGQSFLYRDSGINSTVLEVHMKRKVRGDYLQRALTTTLVRFPYMASKLVEKDGDFYLEASSNSMNVIKTNKQRKLGSIAVGYHLIDVTYWDNRISLSFHHALCDGRGIKPFLETLIYYYCCFYYNKTFDATGFRLAGDPLLPNETQEPIRDEFLPVDKSRLPEVIKDGYALPENNDGCDEYYRYEIKLNRGSFLQAMKSTESTPAMLLSMLVSSGISEVHQDADKPIVCSMAIDYRKNIGMDNTHKNCVGSIYLPYTKEIAELSKKEQSQKYRLIMKEQRQTDAMNNTINSQIGLCMKLDQIKGLEQKRAATTFLNDLLIDTYVISYIGQIHLGEHEEYVESIHLYNSGVKGLRINLICAGEYFTVDMLQSYHSDEIIDAFLKNLYRMGIDYTCSDRIKFETIKDKAFLTASRQAERYYKIPGNQTEDAFKHKN